MVDQFVEEKTAKLPASGLRIDLKFSFNCSGSKMLKKI